MKINSYIDSTFTNKNSNINNISSAFDLQKNFLNLLIAQIKNQDPTDPIKNTELTSQLAQINTASGIEKLNNSVSKFSHQINTNQTIQISSLIGHHIMIPSSHIVHTNTKNTKTKFGIELIGSYATSVVIQIKDGTDKVVHVEEMKNAHPGVYSFTWNGKNLDGNISPDGIYNISVIAKNNNQNVPVTSLSQALVNSIIKSSSLEDPIIDLGATGTTTLSNIREIFK